MTFQSTKKVESYSLPGLVDFAIRKWILAQRESEVFWGIQITEEL